MKRIYHTYDKWEEVGAGMWSKISSKDETDFLHKAIVFTGNAELYGEWMLKVLDAWPISCENSLSATEINRKAWVGHAACCMAIGSPEHITRLAWGHLSEQQRIDANKQADKAIKTWEDRKRLDAILSFGKKDAIQLEYPTKLRWHLKQQDLFQATG